MRRTASILIIIVFLCTACGTNSSMQGMNGSMPMDRMQMDGMTMPAAASSPAHVHSNDAIAHFAVAMNDYVPHQQAAVTILIQNKWNRPIDKFDTVHEKLMHLFVISKDLSYFDHIHPEYKGGGRFDIATKFPAGGDYQLIADFTPKGLGETVQSHWVHIDGQMKKTKPLKPDRSLTKTVSGMEVTLSFDHLMAGMNLQMVFSIRNAVTKQPVTDLQLYLGSLGHAVAIRSDAKQFVHVHPNDPKGRGPDAAFLINFPSSGIYKIWGQFQHDDEVFTVPFTVEVP